MKIDKKKIIIVAVCVAAVLVTVIGTNIYSNVTASQESVAYKETTVVKGNLTVGVTESGSVTLGTLTQEKLREYSQK